MYILYIYNGLCKQYNLFILVGQMLDTLARKSLWEVGLNYMHKTGHGVGAYLTVHEGIVHIIVY